MPLTCPSSDRWVVLLTCQSQPLGVGEGVCFASVSCTGNALVNHHPAGVNSLFISWWMEVLVLLSVRVCFTSRIEPSPPPISWCHQVMPADRLVGMVRGKWPHMPNWNPWASSPLAYRQSLPSWDSITWKIILAWVNHACVLKKKAAFWRFGWMEGESSA